MIVRFPEGGNIAFPQVTRFAQASPSPGKALASELHDEQVGNQARMPSVSIWEGVYLGQAVMEAYSDFVRRIRFVLNPRLCIVEQHA